MNSKKTRRLSPSLMVSVIALVLALGGSALALPSPKTHGLKKNSVSSKQVKNESLKGNDVKNDSLTGADVNEGSLALPAPAANSVKGDTVVDGSLTGADVDEASLGGPLVRSVHMVQVTSPGTPGAG